MTEHMYEVGTSVDVRAFHVMPGMPPPEGERHSHDYRLEVEVHRESLDDRGMVVDLDALDRSLGEVAGRIAEQDLETVVTGVEAVTVEALARWVHARLVDSLGVIPAATLRVRVWETPTAYGGYAAAMDPAALR